MPSWVEHRPPAALRQSGFVLRGKAPVVPDVTRTDPDGVDYGWVMQVTFVTTLLVGAPLVAGLSLFVEGLDTWGARVGFAVRVGALVWFLTAILTYSYARREQT
jgi:hypothetical protein